MTYKAAVIGCGKIGSGNDAATGRNSAVSHAAAYVACPNTKLVAVCDTDQARADASADFWKVPSAYSNPIHLLQEARPEIISLCTPNATHAEMLDLALNSPGVRAVLAEKPLTLDVGQARRLVQLAKDRGVVLSVNYSRRFSPGHRQVRDLIQTNGIGRVQSVSGYYTKGILHNGTHWLDLARWLIGDIDCVLGSHLKNQQELDTQLDARFSFKNGASGALQALDAESFSLFEMDIVGTEGRIRLTESGQKIEQLEVTTSPYDPAYRTLGTKFSRDFQMENVILHAVNDLVESLEKNQAPACTGKDGIDALALASLLIRSAREGKPLKVEE